MLDTNCPGASTRRRRGVSSHMGSPGSRSLCGRPSAVPASPGYAERAARPARSAPQSIRGTSNIERRRRRHHPTERGQDRRRRRSHENYRCSRRQSAFDLCRTARISDRVFWPLSASGGRSSSASRFFVPIGSEAYHDLVEAKGGRVTVPDAPGLGRDPDLDILDQMRCRRRLFCAPDEAVNEDHPPTHCCR